MSPRICSVDECSNLVKARELCGMHYQRGRTSGELDLLPVIPPAERLTTGLVRQANGCLEWTGYTNVSGYGVTWFGGRKTLAHRVAWILANGPIPEGMYVCHTCDNPPCCNVAHLFLGDAVANGQDMAAKGRGWQQKKTHCPQGHPYDEANTVRWHRQRTCRTCGNIYKTAYEIKHRAAKRDAS